MILTDTELLERNVYPCYELNDVAKAYLKLGYKLLLQCKLPTNNFFTHVFFNYMPSLDNVNLAFIPELKPFEGETVRYEKPQWESPYYYIDGNKIIDIYGPLNLIYG